MIHVCCRTATIALLFAAGTASISQAQAAPSSCPEGYVELRREVTGQRKLRIFCQPVAPTPVESSPAGSAPVDLSDVSPEKANRALMKHQWEMSIDWRYQNDPALQQYIRNLWSLAYSPESAQRDEGDAKLKGILADQLKANGLSGKEIAAFFTKVATFYSGQGEMPKTWSHASKFARDLDAAPPPSASGAAAIELPYYDQLVKSPGKGRSVKASVSTMSASAQTVDDCVLHAIANGAQVPFKRVKSTFTATLKNLGMDRIEERNNPELAVAEPKHGGRGGLNPFEEMLIAEQLGKVIAVPRGSFARAIESTGRPVVTTVVINDRGASHEVVVTGVYRSKDGKVYYAVMDSNLKGYQNFTAYVEKAGFERHMPSGGYVIVPAKKK